MNQEAALIDFAGLIRHHIDHCDEDHTGVTKQVNLVLFDPSSRCFTCKVCKVSQPILAMPKFREEHMEEDLAYFFCELLKAQVSFSERHFASCYATNGGKA